ncbi:hypothetical protein Pan216_32020 [Planctomycetes bacterium Pan216]|uniref:DUF985 domain-containing protein n=1 Tax=Kolteria novifilia TaxID=2527975 RepID=A0A518B5T7_9BACT|nr:hypothetical protein Pan216_32020 [Planctomycetes bacterium Pan216]
MGTSDRITADQVIERLGLSPLPGEGGYYRETYRSKDSLSTELFGGVYSGPAERSAGTAIFYMHTPETYSALHVLPTDEVYHFYAGDPVELTLLDESGVFKDVVLGTDFIHHQVPQFAVPAATWQGSRLIEGGSWALMGTTMAPGFDFADLILAEPKLLAQFPDHAERLKPLMPA